VWGAPAATPDGCLGNPAENAFRLDGDSLMDASVVRFAVAGIVVGLMGCFVFGLYLRRWLRERKATLTSEHTEVTEVTEVTETAKP